MFIDHIFKAKLTGFYSSRRRCLGEPRAFLRLERFRLETLSEVTAFCFLLFFLLLRGCLTSSRHVCVCFVCIRVCKCLYVQIHMCISFESAKSFFW